MVVRHTITPTLADVVTMGDVQDVINKNVSDCSKTLVIFDIDMTLTVPQHPALYYPNMTQYQTILASLFAHLPPFLLDQVLTLAIRTHKQILLETASLALIRCLQTQGIPTMACTAVLLNDLAGFGSMTTFRFHALQNLGIDLRQAFPTISSIELDDIPRYYGLHPVYQSGILYANGERGTHNKGTVLVSFLKRLTWMPDVIVAVDDRRKNLIDLEQALLTADPTTKFVGLTYVGSRSYAPKSIDEETFKTYWQQLIDRASGRPSC